MNHDLEKWAARAAPAVFVVLWSSGFIGTKYALSGAEPLTFLTIRMVYVSVLLAVIVAVIRPAWPRGAEIGHSIVAGLLVHGFYLAGVSIGIYHSVPAGLSALIPGLQPILTSTLANRWLGERVTLLQWAGLVLGLSGVLLVLHTRSMTGDIGWGWFATGVALVSITIGTLYQKRYCSKIDWRTGNLVQFAACGVMYAIGALLFETREVIWSKEFILGVSWLVIALSIGSISVLYWLIRRAAATQVASLFYLVPATTALMAYVLFDERLDWLGIVGMAVCAAGVFLVNKPATKSDKTEVSPGS
jgi:drug/metabolite transporter (DMT)-like permease